MSERNLHHNATPVSVSPVEKALEMVIESTLRRVVREELVALRTTQSDELVTVATFAQMRAVSKSFVRAAIRDGRLPASKVGRAVRIRANAQIGEVKSVSDTPAMRATRILGAQAR